MDDILLAQPQAFTSMQENLLTQQLSRNGLTVAPEKIQRGPAWKYLGWEITDSQIRPQKMQLDLHVKTLHDAQHLLGDLQWLHPVVGISNDTLDILRPLLHGTNPAQAIHPTPEQVTTLHHISTQIAQRWVDRRNLTLPVDLTVLTDLQRDARQLLGALTQCKKKKGEDGDSVKVLEWLFTSIQLKTTIQQKIENVAELVRKGCTRVLQLTGCEPDSIYLPMKRQDLEWYLQHSPALQISLLSQASDLKVEPLQSTTLRWISNQDWITIPKRSERSLLNAVTVFTDAGKKSCRATVTWQQGTQWHHHMLHAEPSDSLQTLELVVVVWAFINWNTVELNVVTDSLCVAGVVQRIEGARIKDCQNKWLAELLRQLRTAISLREHAYSIIHIRSHKWSEGLGEGNTKADQLVTTVVPLDEFTKAREVHNIFHQNAEGLHHQFKVTMEEARGIVRACPTCSYHGPGLGMGVNPRGLGACELWQMDVTHVLQFGRLKYVHVTIDTYSQLIWATAQTGEKALHVKHHLTNCFAVMGVPQQVKTGNGPAYASEKIRKFCQQWGIKHVTGIPRSPTGQAIIERANQTLKLYLAKFTEIKDPQEKLLRTLFVLNH